MTKSFDTTSDNVTFPYMKANFDGKVFLENRDNFAINKHIESIKIFEMDSDFRSDSSAFIANKDSANRGGKIV